MKEIESNFDRFSNVVKKSIVARDEICPEHGNSKHSHCTITGISICIECLKERRFGIQKEKK